MKKLIFICSMLLIVPAILPAQSSDYKVVFDLTSRDTLDQLSVLRWVNEVKKADPNAMLEVVMYGKGVYMGVKENSSVAARVEELTKQKNVSFNVCAIAIKNLKIDQSQLIPGVGTVPDGIKEIVDKQHAGWGYIKVTH
ncbi:MAG TPA: DsrE family protein [Chitinophagaceae bacterium]